MCGQYHKWGEKCSNELCNILKNPKTLKVLFAFDFDESTIGTINYIEEFNKASKILLEEYFINKLSAQSIFDKYDCSRYIKSEWYIRYFIVKKLGKKLRNKADAVTNALETGVLKNTSSPKNYKTKKHITWENKNIFLRSSYEIDYANILD